jgi:hypothetical protein
LREAATGCCTENQGRKPGYPVNHKKSEASADYILPAKYPLISIPMQISRSFGRVQAIGCLLVVMVEEKPLADPLG